MPEEFPYLLAATAVIGAWVAGLVGLDVLTPSDVRAFRRLRALRGYEGAPSPLMRRLRKTSVFQRAQVMLDLDRQLALADRTETPSIFLAKAAATCLAVFAALMTADAAGLLVDGDWAVSPWLIVVVSALCFPLLLFALHRAARRVREDESRTLGDMLILIAVMTSARGFRLDEAVRLLSRCVNSPHLQHLIDQQAFRRLMTTSFRTTVEQYRLIGQTYQVPELVKLGDAAATANVGIAERDVFTRLALSVYQDRLAEARVHSSRAKILITLPVAAMLIPLLILIGAPTFSAISGGIQGG
jgi:hypothetical protein